MSARPVLPARRIVAVVLGAAAALALVLGPAGAQGLGDGNIGVRELRSALIWTGHLSLMARDEPEVAFRKAFQGWQRSKHYAETAAFPDEQAQELLADGEARRSSVGWATLEDKSIGFSIGVPTRLVKFRGARNDNAGLRYDFEGPVTYALGVRYGDLSCANLDTLLKRVLRLYRATFQARYSDGLAVGGTTPDGVSYLRVQCRTTGVVIASVDVARQDAERYGMLLSAMGDSLSIGRHFNPTATPQPRLDAPQPAPGDLIAAAASEPSRPAKAAAEIDASGKSAVLKRATRDGTEPAIEEVFARVAPAVFVVRAGERLGSAVAVGEHELLTNCHVVGDEARVTLVLDKDRRDAEVVSRNAKADRCVLRTAGKLDKWVSIRPYDDIKVGERALTIGTPQGLDHTVADGIVSSKRTHEGRRLIQTSAPISQGSSGGGLFDAQGHLLGITTFQFRVGQNLNFAIAAEDYAR